MIERLNIALEGRYRIERELGEGGMATVFLAEDLKHDRQVAIKVLKPELAAVVGAERFLAEIKTTARLQHPHILPLHDSGEADGFLFYVMPYVEGESLRERLEREQQLPVEEAVELARKVADALEYAHEQDVVHRDIKPANILMSRGNPLVADFGIALAVSQAGGGRITETGLSLGTPHYMSPEQASGERTVDRRSDIYALGCVLYEMLAGEPPYGGPTSQAVLARILTSQPQRVSGLRRTVPAHVDAAVAKALEKLPADRFASARELRDALSDAAFRHTAAPAAQIPGPEPRRSGGGRARDPKVWALAAGNVLLLFALLWSVTRPNDDPLPPPHHYVIDDSLRTGFDVAISRVGDVVYEASGAEGRHLRLRRASETGSIVIPNTTDGVGMSFSPDGEWVAFVAGSRDEVKKVQLATGTSVTVVAGGTLEEVYSTHWEEDGTILLAGVDGVHRVPDVGGVPEQVTEVPSVFARLLPGGDALLHTVVGGGPSQARVMVTGIGTGDTTTVAPVGGNAIWSPTGHILYGHPSATVFAVPFDPKGREVTGAPVPVQENVLTLGAISFFALSPTGSFAYIGGAGVPVSEDDIELAWMRMDGSLDVLPLDATDHGDVRLSPDGRQAAYTREGHIYIFDLDRGTNQRFTFEGENHHDPVWSPDGRRIAFTGDREEGRRADIYVKDVDGRSPPEWAVGIDGLQYPAQWLEGDTLVIYSREVVTGETDIILAPVDSTGEAVPLLRADWNETSPRVSPDGSLMAYSSDETGEQHLFVRQFPGMGGRWQVSERPVEGPSVWAPSGDAIYYESADGPELIRADLEFEPSFRVVSRTVLHDQGLIQSLADIHPDGQRLLVTRNVGVAASERTEQQIVVVANWLTELRQRLGEEEG